jgi:hypothetical protein
MRRFDACITIGPHRLAAAGLKERRDIKRATATGYRQQS